MQLAAGCCLVSPETIIGRVTIAVVEAAVPTARSSAAVRAITPTAVFPSPFGFLFPDPERSTPE